MLLEEGSTCWRVATAPRAAFLLDMADYFMAAREAMKKAKRSIHLLNWAFEPDTLFEPQPGGGGPDGDRFANFLRDLACGNPELDVRILCWKSALPVAATQNFFPLKDRKAFAGTPVRFVLDDRLPTGASHHQKVIVIDDMVAFCGGGDIGPDRWDTPMHLDDDPRRKKAPSGDRCFDSRHEVMSIVDGPAAAALGELFRARWLRATQEQLPGPPGPSRSSPWPACVKPDFRDVAVGLSLTYGKWRAGPEVRESEELYLASIAGAKRRIYLENQYFTSPIVAEALAQRLAEPRGPEVILVSAEHSPSYFDQMTMDRTRSLFIQRLKDADRHGRLHVYSPVTTLGRIIIVHAKLAIIDDVLLRVGSSNLNNRSAGFDSECDLSLEASGPGAAAVKARISEIQVRLIAHWLGCADEVVAAALQRAGSLGKAIEALRLAGYARLRPIAPTPLGPFALFVAEFHLGDPISSADSLRPWKRRRLMKAKLAKAIADLKRAHLPTPEKRLSAKSV
jgi:phosphatidylserine/phosphatidylglycerophosphate/cardiolipin synthase-like enzyme